MVGLLMNYWMVIAWIKLIIMVFLELAGWLNRYIGDTSGDV